MTSPSNAPCASSRNVIRPYGDTTGDGMVQVSFTLPLPHDKRAEGAAAQLAREDGHRPRPGGARQADGSGLHLLRRVRPGQPPRGAGQGRGVRARLPAADPEGGQRADQEAPAPTAGGRGRVHRYRCAHRRHRRDPQHQGLRRGEGPGVLLRASRCTTSVPRCSVPELVGRRGHGEGRCGPRLAGRDPARRAPAQHQGDDGRVPGGVPRASAGRCSSSAARASTSRWPTSSGSTASSARARHRARSPRTWCTDWSRRDDHEPAGGGRRQVRPWGSRWSTGATCPTPTPTTPATSSTAPTCSALFGDVATELMHPHRRRRGAVRLLLRRPVPQRAAWRGRRRGDRDPRPRGAPQPGDRVRRPRRVPRHPRTGRQRRGGPGRAAADHHGDGARWSRPA